MRWKRFMAIGCSHGHRADPKALAAVIRFKETWKPHAVVHLGDFIDTAAFRSGAQGTADEAEDIKGDFAAGLEFLERIGATIVLCGNHEHRLWKDLNHYSAKVKTLAGFCVGQICEAVEKQHAELVPYVYQARRRLGNYSFAHGWYYNESACRDHAEAYGNIIFAHTHKTGLAKGRRVDNPTGISVGTLSNIPAMEYASPRRSTLAWSQGFVWGEYTDSQTVCWLHEQPQGADKWILPL